MPTIATGIKNKNYLNVKNGKSPWIDAGGKKSKTDSRGHAVFTDPAYGVRAGIMLLRKYFFTHNLRTIAEILARWAPATDTIGSLPDGPKNSPLEYSTFVAGRMGIGYNEKLDIFNEDKSIGNISRLRGLFFAMAEYEVGNGFKTPIKVFNAGLELVQPGITTEGTTTGSGGIAESTPHGMAQATTRGPVAAATSQWKINGSVGRWEKGAVNTKADVEAVQDMLRSISMILREPSMDPGGIDGVINRTSSKSTTVQAIEAFQSRISTAPDGVINVGQRTWQEMVRVLSGSPQEGGSSTEPQADTKFFFPLGQVPSTNWTSPPRSFGSNRAKGKRAHAGCDLYAPIGTTVHAITDGTVVRGPEPFYAGTFSIEIDHGTFLARYGEVQGTAFIRKGDKVTAGQPIAKVGRLVGIVVPSAMLHLELYDKSAHGPLTVPAAEGRISSGRPFMRRKDLIDPTPKLNEWKNNLP
ncbi:MAG TPA: peptidoglycan DD-metalloendopeptidase family protein [Blastocatellia bacterium]|nr:peptidoglycan DD-metalloendopeptidase family protein [Blastocatellia bacterium]